MIREETRSEAPHHQIPRRVRRTAGSGPEQRTGRSRVLKTKRAVAVSLSSYRHDALYRPIVRAVETLLARGKVVAPVDVLVAMGLLDAAKLKDWRFGRVPFLEKVTNRNLTRLSRLLRILRFHAHDLNLVPSSTVYLRWGKGPKQRLRFTKTGDVKLEEAYSRHFLWPGKGPFHPPARPRDSPSKVEGATDEPRVRS